MEGAKIELEVEGGTIKGLLWMDGKRWNDGGGGGLRTLRKG
jgi:hypothetical protein